MKVAANQVERELALAAVDAENAGRPLPASQMDELAAAFRRAGELRRMAFGRGIVRGMKDKVPREVLTTHVTETVGGRVYRLCLVRYTETQERCRRRASPEYLFRRVGDHKGRWMRRRPAGVPLLDSRDTRMLDVLALLPYHCHQQMIREDRIERGT